MPHTGRTAPAPDLRIVLTESLLPHEDHDSQRSLPLIERMRSDSIMINPPVVAPIGATQFVILDGANRAHAFKHLAYPHILVQVASYESGLVELETWQHVVCAWDADEFITALNKMPEITLHEGQDNRAIAHILLRDGRLLAIRSPIETTHERNAALRSVVQIYQQRATLHRTAISEPEEVWALHPDACALVIFPRYEPADIIAAAKHHAYLPPGVSRHIVHGRAVRVNYPMEWLRDPNVSLREKNEMLLRWLHDKIARRQVRYYAEDTYQFDE